MTDNLKCIKCIILVISGKGGVGKSTVASHLAVAMATTGHRIAIIDADIYGPSIPHIFSIKDTTVEINKENYKINPVAKFGMQIMSIGMMIHPDKSLIWRGPMISKALDKIFDANWQDIDVAIVDMPPGTGDIPISIAKKFEKVSSIVVTTPQNLALIDVRRVIDMLVKLKIPINGIVENMSYCLLNEKKTFPFGSGGGAKIATEYNLPMLANIPLDPCIQCNFDDEKELGLKQNSLNYFTQIGENLLSFIDS